MKSIFTFVFTVIALAFSLQRGESQRLSLWTELDASRFAAAKAGDERVIFPTRFRTYALDVTALQQVLAKAPLEGQRNAASGAQTLSLPLPDGRLTEFQVEEYSMMEPALARQFPSVKTYHGYRVDDPQQRVRLDWTANGLSALIQTLEGTFFIKPYRRGDTDHYISYLESDFPVDAEPFVCGTVDQVMESKSDGTAARAGDCQFRAYRLAVAVTGQYATTTLGASTAGTAADDAIVLAHVVSSINQINAWYERDITTRLVLIGNLTDIFYYNSATDPYDDSDSGGMLAENSTNLAAVIGNANFDIGHALGYGGGSAGIAGVGVLCGSGKARGVTQASASGITATRFLKVWAHEMGHQFGAGHTQNEDCQRSSASAMEPGSGSTIMSYVTSACNNQVQGQPDFYFHAISIQQMSARTTSTSCATILPSANSAPTVSAGLDRTVPSSTPLRLIAVGSDPNNDALTYTWEQYNNDVAQAIPPASTNTLGPSFRSLPPSASNERYLPNAAAVRSGTTPTWEVLPSVARTMDFRVTVRDNSTNSIGCTAEDQMRITTVAGGPFAVTAPTGASTSWGEGETRAVNWSVAGTNNAPVGCANVDILLSYDGGQSYAKTLATSVPNVGTANIIVPTGLSSTARVLVRCADNIFYNISPSNFKIVIGGQPTFTLVASPTAVVGCPGASANVSLQASSFTNFGGSISLSASGLPTGVSASFSANPISATANATVSLALGGNAVPGIYPILVTGTSGAIVRTTTFNLTVREVAGTVSLTSPQDGEVDTRLTPTLSWAAKANATSYQVQVSLSSSFMSLVTNATRTTNYLQQPTALASSTTYYWRVKATTTCGDTPWSSANSFVTGICLPSFTQSTPVNISATGTPTVTSVLTVTQVGTISNLAVSNVTGSHTYAGDLTVTLIAPGGSPSARLWVRACGSADNFNLSLSDDAGQAVADAPCSPLGQGGTYRPADPLSVFNGLPTAGDWTLQVQDLSDRDGGQLTSWTLNFCLPNTAPLPVELISFDASAREQDIRLTWRTASEVNNAGFDVERRAEDETAFTPIKMVSAAANAGVENAYTVDDADVVAGERYYYRLRQRDRDGRETFSEVRTAALNRKLVAALTVRPNPVREELFGFLGVDVYARTEVRLFDLYGRVVYTRVVTGPAFQVSVRDLPAGMYILEAQGVGESQTVRVVVE